MEKENIWKEIKGFEGLYRISENGEVFSVITGRIRKPSVNNSGYQIIHLYKDKKDNIFTIHRLVANAFIPNPNNFPEINHINENKLDNRVVNLEWCDRKYNQQYSGNITKWVKAGAFGGKMKRSKVVYQFSLNGDFIKEWFSAREAESQLKISRQGIGKCCLGKYKQCGGYIWSFSNTRK